MSNKLGINPSAIALGTVVVAFATGAGAGYIFAKKQLEAIADQEIEDFKEEWNARQQAHFAALDLAAKNEREKGELPVIINQLNYASTDDSIPVSEPTNPNGIRVFDHAPAVPKWDQDAEEGYRREHPIYVISREEFFTNEHDFEEYNYTWYSGDDVLCNNRDEMILDVVQQIGSDCLSKFGYGSDNEDIVYVQNEHLARVYEITRTDGKYSEVVQGLGDEEVDAELQHSARRPKKFRSYHDS